MRYPKSVNGINRKDWILDRILKFGGNVWIDDPVLEDDTYWNHSKGKPEFTFRHLTMKIRTHSRLGHIKVTIFYKNNLIFVGNLQYERVKNELSEDHFYNLTNSIFTDMLFLYKKDATKLMLAKKAYEI